MSMISVGCKTCKIEINFEKKNCKWNHFIDVSFWIKIKNRYILILLLKTRQMKIIDNDIENFEKSVCASSWHREAVSVQSLSSLPFAAELCVCSEWAVWELRTPYCANDDIRNKANFLIRSFWAFCPQSDADGDFLSVLSFSDWTELWTSEFYTPIIV